MSFRRKDESSSSNKNYYAPYPLCSPNANATGRLHVRDKSSFNNLTEIFPASLPLMQISSLLNPCVSSASKRTAAHAFPTYTQSLPHTAPPSHVIPSPLASSCPSQASKAVYSGSGTITDEPFPPQPELPIQLDTQQLKQQASQTPPSGNEPTKKRLKWTPEEDEVMNTLKDKGNSWDDIAMWFPGRTSDACRLHYWRNPKNEKKEKKDQNPQQAMPEHSELLLKLHGSQTPLPYKSPAKKYTKWTPEEDSLCIRAKRQNKEWHDIAKCLPGRTARACRTRYQTYLKKQAIGDQDVQCREESTDVPLANTADESSPGPFTGHPLYNPVTKFKPEEDTKLIELRARNMRWKEIAPQLPGQTPLSCRLRHRNYLVTATRSSSLS